MPAIILSRRFRPLHPLYVASVAAACLVLWSGAALAADKVTFLTSWFRPG